jgi:hypothetical protein
VKLIAFTPWRKVNASLRTEALCMGRIHAKVCEGLHPRTYYQIDLRD